MAETTRDKRIKRRAKRAKEVKQFSKAHGYEQSEIKDLLKNNPGNRNAELDKKAMANVTHPARHREELNDKLTSKNMRNLGGMIPKIGPVPLGFETKGGKQFGMTSDVNRFAQMVDKDYEKSIGHSLHGRGVTSGWGHSKAEAKLASGAARTSDFARHMNPFGGSSRESIMMSMGFTGRDSRILAAKGNFMESMNRRVLAPAFGVFMAYGAMQSDAPLTEYATGVAVGAGLQQGWRAGKSFGNMMGASHKARLLGGSIGAVAAAAVPAAMILGHADLMKNDSFIAKRAKAAYSRESSVYSRDTQASLTMRQAGLEKLSSSYLNNRQQLLGNEASILRNSQT